MEDILIIDESHGEGGGQILRTALSLSTVTRRAFRLVNIRAGRRKPGLMPRHLSAVRAAAISGAVVSGDRLGSTELAFAPAHPPQRGRLTFDVSETAEHGSAGSVTLILQTLIVRFAFADGPSTLQVRGGTHVDWAPPLDHLADQLRLPLALAKGGSAFTVAKTSGHLLTNFWTIRQLGVAKVLVDSATPCCVRVEPTSGVGRRPDQSGRRKR